MNSSCRFLVWVLCLMVACSTDPDIDWDKLRRDVLVVCQLHLGPVLDDSSGQEIHRQRVIIQKLRSLVDVAFDPEGDQFYGIAGAQVQVIGDSGTMIFEDRSVGLYEWNGDRQMVFPSQPYRLEIILPNGSFVFSEIIAPNLFLESAADTIWVEPDSVTRWSADPSIYPFEAYPVEWIGPGYNHCYRYHVSPGSELFLGNALGGFHQPTMATDLWFDFIVLDSMICVATAIDSPAIFGRDFQSVELSIKYRAHHMGEINLDYAMEDDHWEIENLEEISNIEGAYGFFTTSTYRTRDTCVVALKP